MRSELRRFVSWLIERGVHGLYPNGSTGEFTRFSEAERRRIVQITCDEARGRVPILAGAAEANVKETLAACEAYAGMGARAVAIVSPFYFRLSPESVYAYFAEIASHTPIDVTLYNIPMFASPIDVPTIRRLRRIPAHRRHQGFVGRPGVHDADDRGGPAAASGFHVPHRLGGGAGADAPGGLRRRHECEQQRRARRSRAASTNFPRRANTKRR